MWVCWGVVSGMLENRRGGLGGLVCLYDKSFTPVALRAMLVGCCGVPLLAAGKPIASLAFHPEGDLLTIAAGHKVCMCGEGSTGHGSRGRGLLGLPPRGSAIWLTDFIRAVRASQSSRR